MRIKHLTEVKECVIRDPSVPDAQSWYVVHAQRHKFTLRNISTEQKKSDAKLSDVSTVRTKDIVLLDCAPGKVFFLGDARYEVVKVDAVQNLCKIHIIKDGLPTDLAINAILAPSSKAKFSQLRASSKLRPRSLRVGRRALSTLFLTLTLLHPLSGVVSNCRCRCS